MRGGFGWRKGDGDGGRELYEGEIGHGRKIDG